MKRSIVALIAAVGILMGACAPSEKAPVLKASDPVIVAGCTFTALETSPGGSSAPGTSNIVKHDKDCKADIVVTATGTNVDQAIINAVGLGAIGAGIAAQGALIKPAKGSTMTTNNCGAGSNATVTC